MQDKNKHNTKHCPINCGGSTRIAEVDPSDVQLPEDIMADRKDGESLWHCRWCGQVWYERRLYPPRLLGTVQPFSIGIR